MEILVLSLVGALIVGGGLWLATRDTKPAEDDQHGHRPA